MDVSKIKLPRRIELFGSEDGILTALSAHNALLWKGAKTALPLVALNDSLKDALLSARRGNRLVRGYTEAVVRLARERKGLEKMDCGGRNGFEARLSRLFVISNDGSERFYRQVESSLLENGPRVWGILVKADSESLGGLLFGPGKRVKLVMADHKDAVSSILMSLVS